MTAELLHYIIGYCSVTNLFIPIQIKTGYNRISPKLNNNTVLDTNKWIEMFSTTTRKLYDFYAHSLLVFYNFILLVMIQQNKRLVY